MTSRVDRLIVELRSLAKGPGVRDERLHDRDWPELRRLCKVTERDRGVALKRKITAWLHGRIGQLPEKHQIFARVALGLHPDAQHDNLGGRQDWLAGNLNLSRTTAGRYVKAALEQLARDSVAGDLTASAARDVGHMVAEHEAELRMDLDPPIVTDRFQIEVTDERLDAMVRKVSVPGGDGPIEVLDGGSLARVERRPGDPGLVLCHIKPSRTLLMGEMHKFEMRYTLHNPKPFFGVQPLTWYDMARYRLRFHPDRQPNWVRRIEGVTSWQLEGVPSVGELLVPSPSGCYEVSFVGLQLGLVYGMCYGF